LTEGWTKKTGKSHKREGRVRSGKEAKEKSKKKAIREVH
jgi:hypothetical protein